MLANFKDFIENVLVESLHPELQNIVTSPTFVNKTKQTLVAHKIRELTARGEPTGIEGNTPKGSSRMWIPHAEKHEMRVDNIPTRISVGTKIAIRAPLDVHHNKAKFDDLSLGELQNRAENDDGVADRFRTLIKEGDGVYRTNKENGIFPPLIEADTKTHRWAHVGAAEKVTQIKFRELTKKPGPIFEKGISHSDFVDTLTRDHDRDYGKYWSGSNDRENELDAFENHPLVSSFLDYHRLTGTPPHDYDQLNNLGIFTHPLTGVKSIVARDHGYDSTTKQAYENARYRKWNGPKNAMRKPLW